MTRRNGRHPHDYELKNYAEPSLRYFAEVCTKRAAALIGREAAIMREKAHRYLEAAEAKAAEKQARKEARRASRRTS